MYITHKCSPFSLALLSLLLNHGYAWHGSSAPTASPRGRTTPNASSSRHRRRFSLLLPSNQRIHPPPPPPLRSIIHPPAAAASDHGHCSLRCPPLSSPPRPDSACRRRCPVPPLAAAAATATVAAAATDIHCRRRCCHRHRFPSPPPHPSSSPPSPKLFGTVAANHPRKRDGSKADSLIQRPRCRPRKAEQYSNAAGGIHHRHRGGDFPRRSCRRRLRHRPKSIIVSVAAPDHLREGERDGGHGGL